MVKEFPLLPLEKIAKKVGKEIGADRVAASATKELRDTLLEIANNIATEAITLAHHAGRVTVKKEDIVLASR
jgi:histone H3/H4